MTRICTGDVCVPSRVVAWDVQRFEIIVVELRFRPLGDLESETMENLLDLFQDLCQRVLVSTHGHTAGKRHIKGLAQQRIFHLSRLHFVETCRDELLDRGSDLVDDLAQQGAFGWGQLTDLAQGQRDQTLLAEVLDPQLIEALELIEGWKDGLDFVLPGFQLRFHADDTDACCALAMAAICPKASGSRTARSASVFRSSSTCANFRPCIKVL